MPPNPYQQPQPPRRNGWLIGGLAAGLVVLLIGGAIVTWVVFGSSAPYASFGDCEELLAEDVLDGVPGAEGSSVEQADTIDGADIDEANFQEGQECQAAGDLDNPYGTDETLVNVFMYWHATETEEEDYSKVQRDLGRTLDEFEETFQIDFAEDGGTAASADTNAEFEMRESSTGDGGHVVLANDPDDELGFLHENGVWATSAFTTRNLEVYVTYSGTSDVSAEEHLEIAADLGDAVHRQVSRTVETE
ncbi:hypothetical protein [Allosalinactinospora lopnorensis]|uniref:hypothetical protein n=1 Tax=Allosalinactinospora lopnorensis TaxID=1352348 RepID=UPI000623E25D|nr:hypothetical protein [Allosalinactinospora lopnorensis]